MRPHDLCTRPCHGCSDPSYHDAHLTLIGRVAHVWRYQWRRILRGIA